jgi:hypothetical protein
LLLVASCFIQAAYSEGHYQGGYTNIRDFISPPSKGFVALIYDPFYWGGDYRGHSGKKVDSVSGSRSIKIGPHDGIDITATAKADIDVDIFSYTFQPLLFYFTDWEILGAKYGAGIAPAYTHVHTKVSADISGDITIDGRHFSRSISGTRHVEREDSDSGFGDLMAKPVMLDWSSDNYDIVASYSFYAPTGSYDKKSLANAGLGYWSHTISFGGLGYLNKKATAILCNMVYEFNTKKTGTDVYPGQNIILEYGVSQYFATWFAVGVSGASYFQVTDNTGADAINKSDKQQYHSVSGEVVLWLIPGKFGLTGRYFYQYYGENTLVGHGANAAASILF